MFGSRRVLKPHTGKTGVGERALEKSLKDNGK